MSNLILSPIQDQPQIILNEKNVGGRVSVEEAHRFIAILCTKGYNVAYGPFKGFFKTGVNGKHWRSAQNQLSREFSS